MAGHVDDAIELFHDDDDDDTRQQVVHHVCEATGLPEDTVEAVLHALVTGNVGPLEDIAPTAAEHHVHQQLLATKDDVVARVAAHVDDVKAHVADIQAMRDILAQQVGQKDDTIQALQQQLAAQKDDMHRQALARQEEIHKLKEDNARQLALRLLFKEQYDEARRELDRLQRPR